MTQIIFFLTEYAEELLVLLCSLVLVLLLVTLHRMKRITKLIQEIAGNTNEIGQVKCGMQKENHSVPAKKDDGEQETADNMLKKEENAELLSEVLEEVFP